MQYFISFSCLMKIYAVLVVCNFEVTKQGILKLFPVIVQSVSKFRIAMFSYDLKCRLRSHEMENTNPM